MRGFARRLVLVGTLTILGLAPGMPPALFAFAPLGACCVANGSCQDVTALQCDSLGGDFIGDATSCSSTDCAAPIGAPLLSIFGLVGLLGALGGLGAYRLLVGHGRN